QQGQLKCKFPWSKDYTVLWHFWLILAFSDPSQKGWLREDHIDLWVDYMWHGRSENANWAMILLQNNTPLFYANNDKYATAWSDVDKVIAERHMTMSGAIGMSEFKNAYSGIVLDGPSVPIPPPFINLEEDERVEETLTDQDLAEYTIKEKLLELANTSLNENCSAVILKKLLEKLEDPGKFLIPCGFSELKCKALADLGSSINLMPLFVWKKLDVFVLVDKFTFPTDFVIVDYESGPRVPLILGRPLLRTARALIDVHREEMILCDGDERLTLNMRHDTSSYSNQPQKESINMINIFNDSSEDFFDNLFATNHQSGNPTFFSHLNLTSPEVKDDVFDPEGGNVLTEKLLDLDSTKDLHSPHNVNPLSGSITSSTPNHFLEEFADELALITFPPEYNDDLPFDIDSDLKEIEYLLNHDPIKEMDSILKDSIDQSNPANLNDNLVDTMPEMFTDEHAFIFLQTPNVNLQEEYVGNVPVWVKFHDVPSKTYSGDGLSDIANKIDTLMVVVQNLSVRGLLCALYVLSMSGNLKAAKKVDDPVNTNSDSDVQEVFNETTGYADLISLACHPYDSYCFSYQASYDTKEHHKHDFMPKGKGRRPLSLQTVELQVRMCCTGCERVVKRAIYKLRGVDSVEVELELEKVTVIGYVDQNKVLKAVRRAGKRAEFWPYPNPPLYFTSSSNYFKDTTSEYKQSYNYYRHGYNMGDRHGTIPVSQRGDDKVSNMFNDDNINACSVM
nr:heavy metal-associated isoprenylated plant protein 30-like [Tanacetum cinerariifolium]